MSSTINIINAMANGVFSVFELDGEAKTPSFVVVVHYEDGSGEKSFVIPFINKRAFISIDDADTCFLVDEMIKSLISTNTFPVGISKASTICKDAPAHKKLIKRAVPAKGVSMFSGAKKILEDVGYEFCSIEVSSAIERNYSALLERDDLARAIVEDNAKELRAAGASFESLSDEIKAAFDSISNSDNIGILFLGPTGTGKSWAARILANKLGAPYLNQQIDGGTTPDTLVGSYAPNTGSGDGKWEFIPGPLLKAYSEGWVLILEEINYGDPRVLAKLNEFTDGTKRIIVEGKSYERHPNFVVLMTMNPGYSGTDPLNPALKNRFSAVMVPPLSEKQFCDRMVAYSKKLFSKEFFSVLYQLANRIEKQSEMFHEDVKFSIRNAQRLCSCISKRALSLDEFSAAVYDQYVNCLSMDNDNWEKLDQFKKMEQTQNDIAMLYSNYGFAEIKSVETTPNLSAFAIVSDDDGSDKDSVLSEDDLSGLFGDDE